jgi:HAMP domain-containing protein
MMEAALSIRGYTVSQVKPRIEHHLAEEFLPQSVPAYAAAETFKSLRKKYPDFSYKEATLNPTNPANRTVEWESDIVNHFRNAAVTTGEISGERDTPSGRMLYIARPIQIKDPACLACHSVPAAAPASMIKLYGESNGFGWKHNEIIGAQVVSVPMTLPIRNANEAFKVFMGSLAAIFVVTFIVLNVMLSVMIIRPISRMSSAADKISTGDFDVPEFPAHGKDEISILGTSFNRMRRSLAKALKLIER